MIKSGIVSVTFRKKNPRELVDISAKAGLQAIEWGSDIHVPAGNIALAREVRDMTISSGMDVASYGSYYYVGMDQDFAPYLETAVALGAPNIRVWASKIPSKTSDASFWKKATDDARRISEDAKKAGITISAEYHAMTLTDTLDSTIKFLDMINSDNFFSYWQQPLPVKSEDQYPELEKLFATGKVSNVHVFTEYGPNFEMYPLEDGKAAWQKYIPLLKSDNKLRYALLEFIKDEDEELFMKDSALLNELING